MGKPVTSENWEVTLNAATWREMIVPGQGHDEFGVNFFHYQAPKGYIFVDIGMKAKRLNPSITAPNTVIRTNLAIKTNEGVVTDKNFNIETDAGIIIDENGEPWFPDFWGKQAVVNGKETDPFSVGIDRLEIGDLSRTNEVIYYLYSIDIKEESYLRFIYAISDTSLGKIISFKFRDVPAIPFTINK
jgi:hypothetical protein